MARTCACPGCYNTDDDGTMYREETEDGDDFTVCPKHLSKRAIEEGRVTVAGGADRGAQAANAEVVAGLRE